MIKKFFVFIWEIIQTVLIAFLIVLPIRYFIFQPFLVHGQSMEPNFHQGDYLLVDELSFRFRPPQRGEVIVFKYPPRPQFRYIKRIIGLPGEEVVIKNGLVLINGKILNESQYLPSNIKTEGYVEVKLGENEYFVLGDNRKASSDSRFWGPLKKENIIGRVFIRLWPISALAKIETPSY
jgi:signal peptidase I